MPLTSQIGPDCGSGDECDAAADPAPLRNGWKSSIDDKITATDSSATAASATKPFRPPDQSELTSDRQEASSSEDSSKHHLPKKALRDSSKVITESSPLPTDPNGGARGRSQAAEKNGEETDGKARKRRRVVVACDTCRRKKVKCEGLPNPTNTCNNCSSYNYRCTFTSEPDRSRGKYEILESKVETLLSALRSVAPHVAEQFERGDLNISGPTGASAPPQNVDPWKDYGPSIEVKEAEGKMASEEAVVKDVYGPENVATNQGGTWKTDEGALSGTGKADKDPTKLSQQESGSLLPDLEDGRPRYFGKSSTMSLFNDIHDGKDSRPPSPGPASRRASSFGQGDPRGQALKDASTTGQEKALDAARHAKIKPLFPLNSKEWVQLLRRKNTVAVGRDDICTDEWFTRYTLPAPDLVSDLMEWYFSTLHPLMPIVHRQSLERDIAQGRPEKDSAFRGFVFTILAIAARFSKDPRVFADPSDPDTAGDHYAAASRLYHQVYAASLINVQVLLLTATFMHGSIGPGSSWTILGVAIRALQDIGLHQERALIDFTPFEQEIRRRVFWGAFVLDCIFAINMGRPAALRLSDCDVRLPLCVEDSALMQAEAGGPIPSPPNANAKVMSGFIHLIKLNILVQDVVQTLYSPRWQKQNAMKKTGQTSQVRAAPEYKDMALLSKRLDEWVAATPEHARTLDGPFKLQAGILQCGTHDIRLYILKPFLEHPYLRQMLYPQCIFHARECLKVIIELYEGSHISDLVFIFQQAFMSTGTFMITVWHACRDPEKLAEDNDLIEATLRMFSSFDDRYFSKIFQRAHRILRNVAARCIHTMTSDQRERISRYINHYPQDVAKAGPRSVLSSTSLPSIRSDGHGVLALGLNHSGSQVLAPTEQAYPSTSSFAINRKAPVGPIVKATGSHDSISQSANAADYWSYWSEISTKAAAESNISTVSSGFVDGRGSLPRDSAEGTHHGRESNSFPALLHPGFGGPPELFSSTFTGSGQTYGTIPHQLEDLSWTDYFSKFLDELGGPEHLTPTDRGGTTSPSPTNVGLRMGGGSPGTCDFDFGSMDK
ncbi:hypothetical protein IE53DRAFT_390176 [Violaceomyces palustris]|uniref:Uncharacterized protein n=1 Tax=Violaceomyces palustris TaxID=1673888 RepID=A0ACD0NPG4_9BASI|nr:hypothetical protein IE53DRAFT_390176 [Violaceomyces palustris]